MCKVGRWVLMALKRMNRLVNALKFQDPGVLINKHTVLHLIDVLPTDQSDPVDNAVKIVQELEKFSQIFLNKPFNTDRVKLVEVSFKNTRSYSVLSSHYSPSS